MMKVPSILIETSSQKIFSFLTENPGKEFIEKEIQKKTGLSKVGVNLALKKLAKSKLVERAKKGRMFFYKVNPQDPLTKQFKILKNIIFLKPLVKKLESRSQKIILFGSWGRGENTPDSDIDLFVLTNIPRQDLEKLIGKEIRRKRIQLIIRTPVSFSEMKKKDPIFFEEITRGITLFEKI